MDEMHADGFTGDVVDHKYGKVASIDPICLCDGFKGNAKDMTAMIARCGCMKCISTRSLSPINNECFKCYQPSITLVNDVCNTCLSKADDKDEINWPKHYNAGKIQPIDAIEDWGLDFRLANAVKYIARHEHKGNAKKDLEKAIWYIQRYIDKELTKDESNG